MFAGDDGQGSGGEPRVDGGRQTSVQSGERSRRVRGVGHEWRRQRKPGTDGEPHLLGGAQRRLYQG